MAPQPVAFPEEIWERIKAFNRCSPTARCMRKVLADPRINLPRLVSYACTDPLWGDHVGWTTHITGAQGFYLIETNTRHRINNILRVNGHTRHHGDLGMSPGVLHVALADTHRNVPRVIHSLGALGSFRTFDVPERSMGWSHSILQVER